MKSVMAVLPAAAASLGVVAASAQALNFDRDTAEAAPKGWQCGVTGHGSPRWIVRADPMAPSAPNVLRQAGSGTFPWCVVDGSAVESGYVEVRFRPVSGKQDQAGGVIWRWKDRDNYYVARANALENNVSLYYTEGGTRKTIRYIDAPVAANAWHVLRVEFRGLRVRVSLDGKTYIEAQDTHITSAGRVGVWTKADSVTDFDDFSFGVAQ